MNLGARYLLGWPSACLGVLLVAVGILGASAANGSGSDRCSRFAQESTARQHLVSGHGSRTVVIGDSYSAGLGLAHPGRSWAARLPGRVHVYGFSGSGFSRGASPCGAVAFDQRAPRALATHATLVVIEGGLNDYDRSDAEIRAGFRRLLAQVAHRKVLVVGPPAAPARARAAAHVDQVLRSEAARVGAPYLSMIDERFGYRRDQLHLTATGHQQFGDLVAARLSHLR